MFGRKIGIKPENPEFQLAPVVIGAGSALRLSITDEIEAVFGEVKFVVSMEGEAPVEFIASVEETDHRFELSIPSGVFNKPGNGIYEIIIPHSEEYVYFSNKGMFKVIPCTMEGATPTPEGVKRYVLSVNGIKPDETGNVTLEPGPGEGNVKSVNGNLPDETGDVKVGNLIKTEGNATRLEIDRSENESTLRFTDGEGNETACYSFPNTDDDTPVVASREWSDERFAYKSDLDSKMDKPEKQDEWYKLKVLTARDSVYTQFAKDDQMGRDIQATYATKDELAQKQDKLTFDDVPTTGSNNPVTSDGIAKAISDTISAAIVFKGTVADEASLPSEGMVNGDMYITEDDRSVFIWSAKDGKWQKLGHAEIDTSKFLKVDDEGKVTREFTGFTDVDIYGEFYVEGGAYIDKNLVVGKNLVVNGAISKSGKGEVAYASDFKNVVKADETTGEVVVKDLTSDTVDADAGTFKHVVSETVLINGKHVLTTETGVTKAAEVTEAMYVSVVDDAQTYTPSTAYRLTVYTAESSSVQSISFDLTQIGTADNKVTTFELLLDYTATTAIETTFAVAEGTTMVWLGGDDATKLTAGKRHLIAVREMWLGGAKYLFLSLQGSF